MGIEPTGKALPELENKRFRANADAKCDLRVNFGGTWGNVGIREQTSASANVSDGVPRFRRDIANLIPLCIPPPVDVELQETARHLRREPNDISRHNRTGPATGLTPVGRLRLVGPAMDDPRVVRRLSGR
jgi:hypothetical protein